MSLIIEGEKSLRCMPIIASVDEKWEVRSFDFMPQQVRDCPSQIKVDISENDNYYVLHFAIPGVEVKNLWVSIKERTLALYGGVTGQKQQNGKYHYIEELLSGIRGEITLPKGIPERPEMARFHEGVLILIFFKEH